MGASRRSAHLHITWELARKKRDLLNWLFAKRADAEDDRCARFCRILTFVRVDPDLSGAALCLFPARAYPNPFTTP